MSPQISRRFKAVPAILLLLAFALCVGASAQRRRPAAGKSSGQQANANTAQGSQQQKSPKKNITPLKTSDTAEGSRITITSDVPLNDYSAFRSGDRYYVVIPQASAGQAKNGMKGRGFEDVQVQKRGDDTVLSFKLQPGTNARVNQKFNRLDVELSTPGGNPAVAKTGNPPQTAPSPTPRPTPQQTAGPETGPGTGINGQPATNPRTTGPGVTGPVYTAPPPVTGEPNVTYAPTPQLSASPAVSPETAPTEPVATPPSEQIAQAQPPPSSDTATTTTTSGAASGTSFGAVLRQNWLLVLIGALVLASILMILAARSRAQRTATPARRPRRKEKSEAAEKSLDEKPLAEAPAFPRRTMPTAKPIAKVSTADAKSEAKAETEAETKTSETKTLESPAPVAESAAVVEAADTTESAGAIEAAGIAGAALIAATAATDEKPAAVVEEETAEVAPAVDMERVGVEVNNVLAGEKYDEAIVGASDAGTRQLVASELLAALAARNVERRERAREAFIKHNYLEEATKRIQTAEAAAERAASARALGYVKDRTATPHLVTALEDRSPVVRRAAVEALAELQDPEAIAPLKGLLARERDRKVPKSLIEHAIEASATIEVEEATTLEAERPAEVTLASAETAVEEAEPVVAPVEASVAPAEESVAPAEPLAAAGLLGAVAPVLIEEAVEGEDETAERQRAEEDAERLRAEEEEAARKAEAERAEAEARRLAEEEAARKAEEERLRAEEEARLKAEEEAKQRAEEEARVKAEEEARRLAAEEAARKAEEERLQAEAEAKRLAEEEAQRRAEEEARAKAEEEARLKAEEEARLRAEEEARLKAEEEARLAAEVEAKRKAEEAERLRVEEEARLAAEAKAAEAEAARLREEEAARVRAEEERRLREEEEARLKAEAEARQRAEEEARLRAEEEARQRAEEEARLKAEEEARLRAEEEERRRAAEEAEAARLKAEEEARLEAEAEARRRAEEEEERQRAAAEAARAEEEARLKAEEEEVRRRAAEEAATVQAIPLVTPVESEIERGDWVEVDMTGPEAVPQAEQAGANAAGQAVLAEVEPETLPVEPAHAESKAIEPSAVPSGEQSGPEKGIATLDEYSTVPGGILRRLSSEEPTERAAAVADLARVGGDDSFREINAAFDDPAIEVRNSAARTLFGMSTDRAGTFTRALREAPPERRRKIGAALASSGLASEAISQLMGESREKTYDAFSLLFLMSKAGEVQPLMRAIEEHPNNEVRLAVVKLLALSGQQEILPAFRRLAVRGSLPTEVRSAVMEAIYQISSQSPTPA